MKQRFASSPRTRVMLPLTGQLDTNGNGTLLSNRFPADSMFSLVNVSLKVLSGVATWEVYITPSNESGNLVGFVGAGVGASVGGGPYPVAPNEFVQVLVTGGTPNAMVTGSIYGVQGVPLDDLPVIPSSSMLTGVAIQGNITSVENAEFFIGNFSVPNGTGSTQTFNITPPTGSQVLIITAIPPAPNAGTWTSMSVFGLTTTKKYFFTDSTQNQFVHPFIFGIDLSLDAVYQVQLQYNAGPAGTDVWRVGAHTATRDVVSNLLLPTPGHGDVLIGADEGILFTIPAGTQNIFGSSAQLVSHRYSNPAPWQAANQPAKSFSFAPGAPNQVTTMVAGVGGKILYLHWITFQFPISTASGFGEFQDSAGNILHHVDLSNNITQPVPVPYAGGPLQGGPGVGLVFKNVSGVTLSGFLQGIVAYSLL